VSFAPWTQALLEAVERGAFGALDPASVARLLPWFAVPPSLVGPDVAVAAIARGARSPFMPEAFKSALLERLMSTERKAVASSPAASAELIGRLVDDADAEVRILARNHPACPASRRGDTSHDDVQAWRDILRGAHATAALFHAAARHASSDVRLEVIHNPGSPLPAVLGLVRDADARVRLALAKARRELPEDVERTLATDAALPVRHAIAGRTVRPAVLDALADDPEHGVRFAAALHPNVGLSAVERVAANLTPVELLCLSRLSPDVLVRLIVPALDALDADGLLRIAGCVTDRWDLPAPLMLALAQHRDPTLRMAAAMHVDTPAEAVARLAADPADLVRLAATMRRPRSPRQEQPWILPQKKSRVANYPEAPPPADDTSDAELAAALARARVSPLPLERLLAALHPALDDALRSELVRALDLAAYTTETALVAPSEPAPDEDTGPWTRALLEAVDRGEYGTLPPERVARLLPWCAVPPSLVDDFVPVESVIAAVRSRFMPGAFRRALLAHLAREYGPREREVVATSPDATVSLIALLIDDPVGTVRILARRHPSAPLGAGLAAEDASALSSLVARGDADPALILDAARHPSSEVRVAVARSYAAPDEALRILIADPDPAVRRAVERRKTRAPRSAPVSADVAGRRAAVLEEARASTHSLERLIASLQTI